MNSSGLWMTWATQGHKLRSCEWYEWLGIMWAKSFRSYEFLRPLVHMNDSRSWAHGSRCYDQLKVVDEMIKLQSRVLRSLDYMNNLGLWMIWTTMGHELRDQDAIKSWGLWLTWMTRGHELKALNSMNNSRLLITWATMGHEPRALNVMNNSKLRMMWMTQDPMSSSF